MLKKILVWDVPTRLFHGLLVIGFLGAFLIAFFSGDESVLFPYHAIIGLVLGAMVVMRVVWGLIGTRYARFGSFAFGPGAVLGYFRGVFTGRGGRHVGHNPGSSYAIYLMLGLVLVIVVTGWMLATGNEEAKEIHELSTYALVGVVVLHVLGVVVHTVRHWENITGSMVTGRKYGEEGEGIRSSGWIAAGVMVAVLVFLAVGLIRNYDAAGRQTRVPGIGTVLQLGEVEKEGGGVKERHGEERE